MLFYKSIREREGKIYESCESREEIANEDWGM